jgi:hypothetical protein
MLVGVRWSQHGQLRITHTHARAAHTEGSHTLRDICRLAEHDVLKVHECRCSDGTRMARVSCIDVTHRRCASGRGSAGPYRLLRSPACRRRLGSCVWA